MENTITQVILETTHKLTTEESSGNATSNHIALLAAMKVTPVDLQAVPPGINLEITNLTATNITFRTIVDGVHCKVSALVGQPNSAIISI